VGETRGTGEIAGFAWCCCVAESTGTLSGAFVGGRRLCGARARSQRGTRTRLNGVAGRAAVVMARLAAPADGEFVFLDENGTRSPFPSLFDPAQTTLSVVVPAYNEEQRLPAMLDETIPYLERLCELEREFSYELIVVDDGSADRTADVAYEYTRRWTANKVRVMRLAQNVGKGGAVKRGAMRCRGARILFCDADGATRFADLDKLQRCIHDTRQDVSNPADLIAIAIGSRYHLAASAERSVVRMFVSKVFNIYVDVVGGVKGIRDTQCGFKLFTRRAAQLVFPLQHVERWSFDVELLYLAQRAGIPITEVPVQWMEIAGSKLSIVKATINMMTDMALMRYKYSTGIWTFQIPDSIRITVAHPADPEATKSHPLSF